MSAAASPEIPPASGGSCAVAPSAGVRRVHESSIKAEAKARVAARTDAGWLVWPNQRLG